MAPTAPVQFFRLRYLVAPPVLLAIATAIALFARSDVNAALLWSQCHSRERLPWLSKIRVLGTPSCFIVSFFQAALDSLRTQAVMSVVLSFVGALLTVCTVEAARSCNGGNRVIRDPTASWMVFNLLGGAVVWQLVIVPAFIHRARMMFLSDEKAREMEAENEINNGHGHGHDSSPVPPLASPTAPVSFPFISQPTPERQLQADNSRQIQDAEIVAIPIAVATGYYIPSILMLTLNTPATIGTWLFFPVYVTLVRKAVRWAVTCLRRRNPVAVHLESSWRRLAAVHGLPSLLSLVSHIFFVWNLLTKADDRKEMTRSTVRFIEVDFQFIGGTVLYWMFVEVGWRVPLAMATASVVVGPGAATALGWLYRETLIHSGLGRRVEAPASVPQRGTDGTADERAPLLH